MLIYIDNLSRQKTRARIVEGKLHYKIIEGLICCAYNDLNTALMQIVKKYGDIKNPATITIENYEKIEAAMYSLLKKLDIIVNPGGQP